MVDELFERFYGLCYEKQLILSQDFWYFCGRLRVRKHESDGVRIVFCMLFISFILCIIIRAFIIERASKNLPTKLYYYLDTKLLHEAWGNTPIHLQI